jgi:lysophospholipid acyltransferase (LPLAT)-like uncharacterized protein
MYSQLVYRTCRFLVSGVESLDEIKDNNQSLILTSWHGMTMMVAGFIKKYLDITKFNGIVPDDHRGDTLKVFADHLGVKTSLLNLSGDDTMRSGRKLVALIKSIKRGRDFLIHPDGPAGPAYKVKPGLAFIAQKTGSPILPLGCYCRHAYHVPRWDRYTLPLPFSKVQIQVGEPIQIPKDNGDLSITCQKLETILNRITFQAEANYYQSK